MTTEEWFCEIREEFAAAAGALAEVSGDRLICAEPEEGPSGEVAVRVGPKPPGVTQWTTSGPVPEVVLTRQPSGEVTQQLTKLGYPVAVTDTQVATELGVELATWTRSRDELEVGLAAVVGVSQAATLPRVATDVALYREAKALSREDPGAALTLGVTGNDHDAQRERLAQAVAVRESWHAAADAAYTGAAALRTQEEPDVPQPFGLYAVIRAEGDLEQALRDPEVRWQTAERLNLNGHLTWVHDEDGRYEEWSPDRSETPEGRREIGDELAQIARQVGVAAPTVPPSAEDRPTPSAAEQERLAAARERVVAARPALRPPGLPPARPEERTTTSPGLSAPRTRGSVLTGQPMVVTSRRRQRELLRSWSGWPLTSILLDQAEVAQIREGGWSGTHHRDPDSGERVVGTTDGLGFGVDDSWHNPAEVIPWPEIEAIARAVPDDVRNELVEFRARWRAHQSAYPPFTASAAAVGCGPIIPGQPLTPRQEAYVRELEAFEVSGVPPAWEQQRAVLEAERLDLHARALSLEAGAEAGDLLELLEDQQVGAAERPGLLPPGPRPRSQDELHQAANRVQTRPEVAR